MESFLRQQQRVQNLGSSSEEDFTAKNFCEKKKVDNIISTVSNLDESMINESKIPSSSPTIFSATKKKLWFRSSLWSSTFQVS